MITLYVGKPDKKINAESLDAAFMGLQKVFEILYSPDLFGEKKTYRITNSDSDEGLRDELFKLLADPYLGAHDVFVVLDKLLVPEKKKIHDSVKIIETKPVKEIKESFYAFALGNAFATGDKKKTWMVFQELLTHDDEMEKTHGLVWWKQKEIMQKKNNFTNTQLVAMARDLVVAYHESRLGGLGLKERLELFFLTLPEIKK
jgi:hypothetical protein